LQREYARTPRGEIIEDVKRGARFDRVNVIGALCGGAYLAIECFRQAADSEFLEAWVANCLLKAILKGYTVIMDNRENLGKHLRSNLQDFPSAASAIYDYFGLIAN
jgi:hypothetical protein